jgi:hypothetical protein
MGVDGFWKLAGSMGGKARCGRAAGFGDNYFRFPGGGYLEASEAASKALVASLKKLAS